MAHTILQLEQRDSPYKILNFKYWRFFSVTGTVCASFTVNEIFGASITVTGTVASLLPVTETDSPYKNWELLVLQIILGAFFQ